MSYWHTASLNKKIWHCKHRFLNHITLCLHKVKGRNQHQSGFISFHSSLMEWLCWHCLQCFLQHSSCVNSAYSDITLKYIIILYIIRLFTSFKCKYVHYPKMLLLVCSNAQFDRILFYNMKQKSSETFYHGKS